MKTEEKIVFEVGDKVKFKTANSPEMVIIDTEVRGYKIIDSKYVYMLIPNMVRCKWFNGTEFDCDTFDTSFIEVIE